MFVKNKGCNLIEDYLITEDRWNDILYHMEHSLFWDKKLHALDIENIMYALKTHKFVNDSEALQTNYRKVFEQKVKKEK